MKKAILIPLSILVIFTLYIALSIYPFTSEKKILGTNYATIVFIQKNRIYPKFWIEFLFEKFEKQRIINAQRENSDYYIFVLNGLFLLENKYEEEITYRDHIEYLEDILICEGLTPERIKVYQDFFILNKRQPTYIQKKYRVFDYVHIKEYCYNKKL
ncbi:hypothetical protein [Acinetobacter gerneri]|uniref:Uncharacterized protein n=1 Tax=Acinetobacter gerneri DSM 14967 = CIP 107464 = MTCC 9824 TaxID=1120926 RepID=N8ZKV5_9GAMM|nr:hypothetical protein [Acinetobacter gerneri]ENV32393.1 hypothetical protein F960_03792 [Acinetobacter gerneri DSM 14967 = CIP 107464 = MTCC 9824]